MGISRPVVPRVGIVAVGGRHRLCLSRPQVEEPVVGFLVPDGETAIVAHGEHKVVSVIGGTRVGGTLPHLAGVENGINTCAESAVVGVKGYLTDIVFYIFVAAWDRLCRGGTEIERPSVGRESRISLVVVLRHQQRIENQLMRRRLIDKDIRALVEDLYPLRPHGMETLMGVVCRVSAVFSRRMPVRIHH